MSVNGDVSEQVVRLSLEGFEILARLTGSGAKNVAAALVAIAKDQQKVRGKTTLTNMLKSGRPLKVFSIKTEDLQKFSEETQFIVITHRKPTMEMADALFGVTMQEKGVSKMVSVKLSDVADFNNDSSLA